MSDAVLEGAALAKSFPAGRGREPVTALHGVDLRLAPGERLALIGRSGSGKTTLLRLLLALERPTAGSVLCEGRPVRPGRVSTLRWYRRLVQYVPQDPAGSLDPRMTVEQLVTDPLRRLVLPGDHRRLALEALERVHLGTEFLHRRRAEISGGQAQRVAIARAVATGSRVLLADEPVSGLDLPLRDEVLRLLAELSETRGLGIVLVTHDLDAARRLCERGLVMASGRIVESGPTSRLLTDPAHDETRLLLDSIPRLPAASRADAVPGQGAGGG